MLAHSSQKRDKKRSAVWLNKRRNKVVCIKCKLGGLFCSLLCYILNNIICIFVYNKWLRVQWRTAHNAVFCCFLLTSPFEYVLWIESASCAFFSYKMKFKYQYTVIWSVLILTLYSLQITRQLHQSLSVCFSSDIQNSTIRGKDIKRKLRRKKYSAKGTETARERENKKRSNLRSNWKWVQNESSCFCLCLTVALNEINIFRLYEWIRFTICVRFNRFARLDSWRESLFHIPLPLVSLLWSFISFLFRRSWCTFILSPSKYICMRKTKDVSIQIHSMRQIVDHFKMVWMCHKLRETNAK